MTTLAKPTRITARLGRAALRLTLASTLLACAHLAAAQDAPPATARAAAANAAVFRRYAAHRRARNGLEERVRALAKRLDLDARQQAEARKLLERQRELVKQVWADHTMSGADHVVTTRAIAERTGDQIRAMLNAEQRRKFGEASPLRDKPQATEADVEHWMRVTGPRVGHIATPASGARSWDGPAPAPGRAQASRDDYVRERP